MTRAFPYLRPPHDVIRPEIWAMDLADGSIPLPDVLTDWDYHTHLSLFRSVSIDGVRARVGAAIPPEAPLTLSARWTASGSLLRGMGAAVTIPLIDEFQTRLDVALPGGDLGGTLMLETVLSTASAISGGEERTASRPGSMLWSDACDIRLQGDAPLFPVAITDFSDLPYPQGGGWFLEIDQNLDAAALGSILLLVDADAELLVRALSEAAAPGPDSAAVLSTLRSAVAATLVEHALTTEDFQPDTQFEPHSLGAALAGLLTQLNLDDWASLRRERDHEPALFHTRMQAATRLWHGLR